MRVSAAARMAIAAGLLAASTTACGGGHEPPSGTPPGASAQPVTPDPAVGALFIADSPLHTCSASVLDSPHADLILTAAHCLAGVVDATFVAGYGDDTGDDHEWRVDAVYLDQRWRDDQDPRADFAIARVSRDGGGSLRAAAGGGLTLGRSPRPGTVVTVTGYPLGLGGDPVSCTAATATDPHGFPSLPCHGLTDGLSGSPWRAGTTITGVIGGLDGGGCDESVSYSPPFDGAVTTLLARAEAGGPGDDAPSAFEDGC